jgi:REG-2-like HAD superfamily hydrolase
MGTLIELRESPARTYARIAVQHGIRAREADVEVALSAALAGLTPPVGSDLERVRSEERCGWREVVRAALGENAAAGPCFDALFAHYADPRAWQLLPHAHDALRAARKHGIRLAIVSNMDARLTRLLDAFGLDPLLDAVAVPSTCGLAKPDPRIFAWALERLHCPPDRALYLGDRGPRCVEAAQAAGLCAYRIARAGEVARSSEPWPSVAGWREVQDRWA